MSVSDFLFAGANPASFTSTSSNDPNMPNWFQDASKGILTTGAAIANQPYQAYDGPRVAGSTDLQNQAYTGAAALQGKYTQPVFQGIDLENQVGQGFDQNSYNQYLAPYLSGANSENSAIADLGTRNLTENLLPAANQGFIANGMFGNASPNGSMPGADGNDPNSGQTGSRNAMFEQRALRDSNESILNAQAGVENNAYNSAMTAYGNGQQQKLSAGANLGALAGQGDSINLANINAMDALGTQQQGLNQSNLNTSYDDFLNQEQYPETQLQQYSALLHGYQPTVGTTSYNTGGTGQTTAQQGYGAVPALTGALGAVSG